MRRFALIAACLLTLATGSPGRAAESETAPAAAQAEVVLEKIQLLHADPNWAMRVIAFPTLAAAEASLPGRSPLDGKIPFGATLTPGSAAPQRSLAPDGIQALLAFPTDASVLVRGTAPAVRQFKAIIRLLDVEPKGDEGRQQYTLPLQFARPELVRDILLELPEGGKAEVEGKSVKISGSPAWLHRALRVAIRLEMGAAR